MDEIPLLLPITGNLLLLFLRTMRSRAGRLSPLKLTLVDAIVFCLLVIRGFPLGDGGSYPS